MHNDTIKVANKIISENDLLDIFQVMNEDIQKQMQISRNEAIANEKYDRNYQKWTTKDFEGTFKCEFDFYDDTKVNLDSYNVFLPTFNNRLHEIKSMYIRLHYSYNTMNEGKTDYCSAYINMWIYENKMEIDVKLNSFDDKLYNVYQFIKDKILNAPEKYDRVIKKKNSIINKVSFGFGLIPALVITTLLIFVGPIREAYAYSYILYPLITLLAGYVIGTTIFSGKFSDLYNSLIPDKKYAGYDYDNHHSVYKDDIDKFIQSSEINIGKNIDNPKKREEIVKLEEKYAKYIPFELILVLILSIIVVVIGKMI